MAAGVTGTSSYNLKFHWGNDSSYVDTDGTQQIALTVNYSGGGSDTQTFTSR